MFRLLVGVGGLHSWSLLFVKSVLAVTLATSSTIIYASLLKNQDHWLLLQLLHFYCYSLLLAAFNLAYFPWSVYFLQRVVVTVVMMMLTLSYKNHCCLYSNHCDSCLVIRQCDFCSIFAFLYTICLCYCSQLKTKIKCKSILYSKPSTSD